MNFVKAPLEALAQHLQNLQNQLIALETQKFQNLKIRDWYVRPIEKLENPENQGKYVPA